MPSRTLSFLSRNFLEKKSNRQTQAPQEERHPLSPPALVIDTPQLSVVFPESSLDLNFNHTYSLEDFTEHSGLQVAYELPGKNLAEYHDSVLNLTRQTLPLRHKAVDTGYDFKTKTSPVTNKTVSQLPSPSNDQSPKFPIRGSSEHAVTSLSLLTDVGAQYEMLTSILDKQNSAHSKDEATSPSPLRRNKSLNLNDRNIGRSLLNGVAEYSSNSTETFSKLRRTHSTATVGPLRNAVCKSPIDITRGLLVENLKVLSWHRVGPGTFEFRIKISPRGTPSYLINRVEMDMFEFSESFVTYFQDKYLFTAIQPPLTITEENNYKKIMCLTAIMEKRSADVQAFLLAALDHVTPSTEAHDMLLQFLSN
jgi:hypothetical protein